LVKVEQELSLALKQTLRQLETGILGF
jgi:hypothetical protein